MDGEEDNESREALEDSEPEAAAEPAYIESSVNASKLVEMVFGEFENLLDPSQGPLSWEWRRWSSEADSG